MVTGSFEARQASLVDLLGSGSPLDMTSGTVIVVPSLTLPIEELLKIAGVVYYEERLLFLLLLLANPDLRVVYVTSLRVEEPIVDYYLRFVPSEVEPGRRLYLVALWNAEALTLTEKILADENAMERLRALGSNERSCLVTFNVTERERELADSIAVPLYGCHPDLVHLGSKSGSRRIARESGIPILPGSEDLHSLEEVEDALQKLRRERPEAVAAVVKLNDGFSGQGNAIVELKTLRSPLQHAGTVFCAYDETWAAYAPKIVRGGAIVEELVRGEGVSSPSVQMRIAPDGHMEVVSTHDQVLGGPDQQVYLGCRFPADPSYRQEITDIGRAVAKNLADKGVIGSFGVDLIVVPSPHGPDRVYLAEINLRLGGTTHPFLMARLATDGTYDEENGELLVDGAPRVYVASDNVKSERFVGLLPEQVIAAIDRAGVAFDKRTRTGVTLHLLGALKRYGKLGMTCIANSHEEADQMFEVAHAVIDELRPQPT